MVDLENEQCSSPTVPRKGSRTCTGLDEAWLRLKLAVVVTAECNLSYQEHQKILRVCACKLQLLPTVRYKAHPL